MGPESSFSKLPAPVTVDGEKFYLVWGRKGYLLLSTVCPHAGGPVSNAGSVFMCPDHGWRFEQTQGECINGPIGRMFSFPVTVSDGHLFVRLDDE